MDYEDLTHAQEQSIEQYYRDIIYPVLTPMAVDQSRPFPLVHSQFIYLAVVLTRKNGLEEEPFLQFYKFHQICRDVSLFRTDQTVRNGSSYL